jgi:hypothetical protein
MALLPVKPAHCGRTALQAQRPSGDGMAEPRKDSTGGQAISTTPADHPSRSERRCMPLLREAIIRISRPFAPYFVDAVGRGVSRALITDAHARTARRYPDM